MKCYAEEEGLLTQPGKMSKSSFTLQNGTPFTPLLLFFLQLGLVYTKYFASMSKKHKNVLTALYSLQ